jgi:hypothetical protein
MIHLELKMPFYNFDGDEVTCSIQPNPEVPHINSKRVKVLDGKGEPFLVAILMHDIEPSEITNLVIDDTGEQFVCRVYAPNITVAGWKFLQIPEVKRYCRSVAASASKPIFSPWDLDSCDALSIYCLPDPMMRK